MLSDVLLDGSVEELRKSSLFFLNTIERTFNAPIDAAQRSP